MQLSAAIVPSVLLSKNSVLMSEDIETSVATVWWKAVIALITLLSRICLGLHASYLNSLQWAVV